MYSKQTAQEGTMKKSVIVIATVAALAATAVAPAHAQRGYNQNQGYNNSAAWNSAAIGAAGMITGAIISGVMQNNANAAAQGYAQPGYGYAQPGYGYAPPPGVVPVYPAPPAAYGGYYQPRACVTQNVPQYDAYGRVVQFIRMCAN
jgi:hypothetical protein